ncbi:PstS family phosphate ABC transporter substrate-binding protein [Thiohalocapsa halophila]
MYRPSLPLLLLTLLVGADAMARERVLIVGSSTVFPFATAVAEQFGKTTTFPTPQIEATGSGGGIKLFCRGVGVGDPDIATASRRMTPSEIARCEANGVRKIAEVRIGYDGIVIANAKDAEQLQLSPPDIWLALARNVPAADGNETLIPNPHATWQDVNPELPDLPIEVLGPPPTSGTRDVFVETAMEAGCRSVDWIAALQRTDPDEYRALCHAMREDGAYISTGENDNLIVQKLQANPDAVGIFGFSFLDQNRDKLQGAAIDGVEPTFEHIDNGTYPLSRPLYCYVKGEHVGMIPGIAEYLEALTRESAWGDTGYLADKGLIPLSAQTRRQWQDGSPACGKGREPCTIADRPACCVTTPTSGQP